MQIRFKNNDCLCLISQMPGSRRYIFFIFLLSILIFLYFSIFRFLDLSISIFYYFSISVFSLLSMNYIFSICYLELNSEKYPQQFLKIEILKNLFSDTSFTFKFSSKNMTQSANKTTE